LQAESADDRIIHNFHLKERKRTIRGYIVKRIIIGIFVLFALSVLLYALIRIMPGDYVQNSIAGSGRLTAQAKEQMIKSYGLDSSVGEGYIQWITNSFRGEFGTSFLYKKPVTEVISDGLFTTMLISVTALMIQLLLALYLGIRSAFEAGIRWRLFFNTTTVLSISLPVFFVALLLQKWLALDMGLFPLQGQVSLKYEYTGILYIVDVMDHLILPILTLVLTGAGGTARYIKEHTERILSSDFVFGAITRGFGRKQIIRYHVLPNLRVLLAVIIGKEIPGLLTRTLIVEDVFALNGLGTSVFAGLAMGDVPLIMGFSILLAFIVLFSALFEDIAYALSDPRIRLGKGGTYYGI